jgi:hypothetical protein|nr:MAG TPA: hypothetical protein [Bacteriophage sp.]
MITPISILKRWFSNFMKPTQEQFWAWLDSFWHKSEKIPMTSVEGLESAIQGTATAEQLQSHLTDSQAHKELFDKKVDKEAGKTLTSNDYTNEEKQTNQFNAKKRVVGLTVTGDVDKIITITFADSTVLQAPFTDNNTLPENLADIKLNSLNFNHLTGVLTGLRSDGQQLTVNLDGRYALKGHTHHWNDIEGKPSLDFIPTNWNRRNNKEVIRTQVDEWLRINDLNSHTNGVYFGTSTVRTDGQVQVGEDGAEAVLSNQGLILKKRLRINAWAGGDGGDIKCKGNLQIGSSSGIVEFRKILDDLVNWNGNTTVTVDINDGLIKLNGIKTNVNPSGERVFATNGQTIHLADYIGTSGYISSNWTMGAAWYGRTINVMANAVVNVSTMEENRNVVFRKCFAGGAVTFNTTGKQVVYTGDNTFNGGDGSTAVVSTANGNKMYIDIRNV